MQKSNKIKLEENELFESKNISFNELMKCRNVQANRCGYLTKEEALRNEWSENDWKKFVARANKMKKLIAKNGFSKASTFWIAKDRKGDHYIIDGQGRRYALFLMQNDGVDISSWMFSCNVFKKPMTQKEMTREIISLNTGSKNWMTSEIRRSDAISSGDKKVKDAYLFTKKLCDEHGLTDYTANLLAFGEKASHQRSDYKVLSTDNYSPYREAFTAAYLRYVDTVSFKKGMDGKDIPRNAHLCRAIRGTNFAISANSCMRRIVAYHKGDVKKAEPDINYFVDALISRCNGDDDYVRQFVKCDKKDMEVVANKIRCVCRRKSVREALYGASQTSESDR
jgi:hypothetical protein